MDHDLFEAFAPSMSAAMKAAHMKEVTRGVRAERKRERNRDKWGHLLRTCGIGGCEDTRRGRQVT